MDDEGEPALALVPAGVQLAWLQIGGRDHVEQVVVGELGLGRAGRGQHQGLQHRRVDGDPVEGLRGVVQDQVHATLAQLLQPLVGHTRADEGLAGQRLQVEHHEFVVSRHKHVGIDDSSLQHALVEPAPRRGHGSGDRVRHLVEHPLAHAHEPIQAFEVEHRGQAVGEDRVGEPDVLRRLLENTCGATVIRSAQDHCAGVEEDARLLRVDDANGPLLQHVAQPVAVGGDGLARG